MTLTQAQLTSASRAAQSWTAARRLEPLRHARLWDAPSDAEGMVSQRHVLQHPGEQVTVMLGGNGSGKTQAAAQLAVAAALGRDNPAAAAWCADNGVDPRRLPRVGARGSGRVLFSALTHDDSLRYHRPKVEEYLPQGARWRNRYAQDEAQVFLPGGGLIVFKANRQGREAYQGDAFDLVILDEEHDEDVYQECLMRVGRRPSSHVVMTMTPLKGLTWVFYHFVEPKHEDAEVLQERIARIASGWVRVHNVDGLANPYIPRAQTEAILAGMGAEEREARRFGRFYRTQGRVFTALSARENIARPPAKLPQGGTVVWGIDFGFRAPFACSALWWDPRDATYYAVAEYERAQTPIVEHVRALGQLAARWGPPAIIAADPEDANSRNELANSVVWLASVAPLIARPGHPLHARARAQHPDAEHIDVTEAEAAKLSAEGLPVLKLNLSTVPARKEVKAGLSKVDGFISPDVTGARHLLISPDCVNLWRELDGLVWRESRTGEPEEVVKKDDHLPDALRYAIVTHQRNL